MKYKVVTLKSATNDLIKISDYLQDYIDSEIAHNVLNNLQKRVANFLSISPNAGARYKLYRYFVFKKYVAVYFVNNDLKQVYVVMFASTNQDWKHIISNRF
jgi:hypothetical protein